MSLSQRRLVNLAEAIIFSSSCFANATTPHNQLHPAWSRCWKALSANTVAKLVNFVCMRHTGIEAQQRRAACDLSLFDTL